MKKIITLIAILISTFSFSNHDKYRLILTTDPATTITVGWNQISGTNPIVYYGTTDFGTAWASYPNSKTVDRSVTARGMNNRFARLTGLLPNTIYYFVIRDDSNSISARFWFRTAPNDLSRLSFIAGGDSRNNRTPRQNANRLVAKLKPHAVFFGGDMTDTDSNTSWQLWFDDWQLTTASDGRMFPIVPTRGNHESAGVIYDLFDTPTGDEYFAMTFGDDLVRAYTLNTNISVTGNQLTWLEDDLSNNLDAVWRTAQYHKPMRPHNSGKSEGEAHYQAWSQLFYDNGVRLVVDCDSHMVKSTWPLRPSSGAGSDEGFIRDDTYGTVYAGEGCWGAPLRSADDGKPWTRNLGSFNQIKLIYIDENKIEIRTVEVDNWNLVPDNTNSDPFALPDSSSYLWNPSQGMVVIINHIDLPTPPSIAFADGEFKDYSSGTNINLGVDVLNDGGGITKVDFYIDGAFQTSDTSAPYSFTHTYSSGAYLVEAIATNLNSQTDVAKININVGSYSGGDTISISDGNDDVEEDEPTGTVYFNSTDLEFFDDGGWQIIGLRFQDVGIPNGATVNSASIKFKSDAKDNQNVMWFRISIEDVGNAKPFESNASGNVSARDKYTTFVDWEVPDWNNNESSANTTTDDLKDLLQGIVDRCDWSQGNSMAFIFERTGPNANNSSIERKADTYEQDPSEAAQLIFTYTYNASIPNPGITKFESNSWSNGAPTSDSMVVILDDYDTTTHGSIDACYLTVNPGKTLTINAGDYMKIGGGLTVDGTLIIEHEGSFVQVESDATVENNGTINVELTTPFLKPRDFMIMGSPMTQEARDEVFVNAFLVLNHTTANFFPHPDVTAQFPLAENFADDKTQNGSFWNQYSGSIDVGRGYLVRPQADYTDGNKTYDMTYTKGTLNNGDITFSVVFNNNKNDSPNVLANPYASSIWANDFINANAMIDELYFWEHITPPNTNLPGSGSMNFSMEDISMYNLLGGTPAASDPGTSTTPNGYISTGQGFGIKANASGTAMFTNSMRRTTDNNTIREAQIIRDRLWLTVSNDAYEMQNTILIGFTSEATSGVDNGFDSRRLATVVSLFSHLEDGSKEFGIQTREEFDMEHKVPLGFSSLIDEDLTYTISLSKFEGAHLDYASVYLFDKVLNTIANLSNSDYEFRSSKESYSNRFVLMFKDKYTFDDPGLMLNAINLYPNPANSLLNIDAPLLDITRVEVFDLSGRKMSDRIFNASDEPIIDMSSFRSALYFVRITTDSGTVTKRIQKN